MNILFVRLFSIIIRFYIYYSKFYKVLISLFVFDNKSLSFRSIIDSNYLDGKILTQNNNNTMFNLNNHTGIPILDSIIFYLFTNGNVIYYTSYLLNKLLFALEENIIIRLLFFSLIDIIIASFLGRIITILNPNSNNTNNTGANNNGNKDNGIKKTKENNTSTTNTTSSSSTYSVNFLVQSFYLLNPVTIISCVAFKLSNIMFFIAILPVSSKLNKTPELKYLFFCINIIVNPSHSVFLIFYYLYYFSYIKENSEETYYKELKKFIIVSLITYSVFIYYSLKLNFPLFGHYVTYYDMTDTIPNIGLIWGILNETFLRFRQFCIFVLLMYNVLINTCVLFLYKNYQHIDTTKSTSSMCFSLLYMVNCICDKYPNELQTIIFICLIVIHYEKLEDGLLNASVSIVYGLYMSILLIILYYFYY